MDSHGPPSHHHNNHHNHQQNNPFQGMMVHHQQNPSQLLVQNSSLLQNNRFLPFNPSGSSVVTPPPKPGPGPESICPGFIDGSGGGSSSQQKKRGRPKKYNLVEGEGNGISLGLSSNPSMVMGQADSNQLSDTPSKRTRGRPPGTGKKQLDALGNCGVGFTPHVILVDPGEDISSKILSFSKDGPRTVCVLSANGSISDPRLFQPPNPGCIVNHEGRYEMISLSGSFLYSENTEIKTNGLSVSLASPDGKVLGGNVAGQLVAASPVQIIVGSFIAGGKKLKYMPSVSYSNMSNFASPPPTTESPPSQGPSSEGSEENGSNHIDRNMGSYSNTNPNHPMHHQNMQMYSHMGWPNPGSKMLPN